MTYLLMHVYDWKAYPQLIGTKEEILSYLYDTQGKDVKDENPEVFDQYNLSDDEIKAYYESNWNPEYVTPCKWANEKTNYKTILYFIDKFTGVGETEDNGEYGYYVLDLTPSFWISVTI